MVNDHKTISVKLRFWTNDLVVKAKGVDKKACWDSGCAIIEANEKHNIKSDAETFNNLDDANLAIKKLMKRAKIMMVSDNKPNRNK